MKAALILLLLLLLCGLLATATALSCVTCSANQESCDGSETTCTGDSNTCYGRLGKSTKGDLQHTGIEKACMPSTFCNTGIFSVTVGSALTLRSAVVCCQQNGCNMNSPILPPVNTTPNGLQCPVCYSKESTQCEGKETMRCTGAEDHCISMTGRETGVSQPVTPLAMRGCATKTACALKKDNSVFSGTYQYIVDTVDTCTKAANSAHQIPGTGSFACLLPSLLLLKHFS